MDDKLNLTWHKVSSHREELFKLLFDTQQFSDVTLISNDQHQFKAHKFVLSSCSSVFQTIFDNSPQNTTIFLRGVHHEELKSILQFIYLGEAFIHQEKLKEVLNVANDLSIKEIKENFLCFDNDVVYGMESNVNEEPIIEIKNEQSVGNDMKIGKDNIEDNKNISPEVSFVDEDPLSINAITENYVSELKEIKTPGKRLYSCRLCDKKLTTKSGINLHMDTAHKNDKFACQECDFQASQRLGLQSHIRHVHAGIKYKCDLCNYKISFKNRKYHMKFRHENVNTMIGQT